MIQTPKHPPVHRAVLDSLRNVALTNRLLRYEISIGPRTLLQSHPNSLRSIEQYWTASAMWLSEIDSSDTRSVLDREPCFRVTQTASCPSSGTGQPPQCGSHKSTPPIRDQYWTENPASELPKQPPVHRTVLDSLRDMAF